MTPETEIAKGFHTASTRCRPSCFRDADVRDPRFATTGSRTSTNIEYCKQNSPNSALHAFA